MTAARIHQIICAAMDGGMWLQITSSERTDLLNRKIKPLKLINADSILASDFQTGKAIEIRRAAIRDCKIIDTLPEQAADLSATSSVSFPTSPSFVERTSPELTAMNNEIKKLINLAIQQQSKLAISFDSLAGTRQDIIIPRRWTNTGELCALSTLSGGEIYINASTIIKCNPYEGLTGQADQDQPSYTSQQSREMYFQSGVSGTESQVLSANFPESSPRLNRRKAVPVHPTAAGVENVNSHDDWSRLLEFYRECVIHENRQKFVIDTSKFKVQDFNAQPEQMDEFFNGRSNLSFHKEKYRSLCNFVVSSQKRNNQQLFVGYPIFVADASRLAPVLIAPVNIKEEKELIVLESEEYEPSYAALASLGLRDEEILSILSSISDAMAQKGESSIQSQVDLIIQMTGDILGEDLNRLKSHGTSLTPNSFVFRPYLFWANPDTFTAKLIEELAELGRLWSSVPSSLKSVLTTVREHAYPEAPSVSKDHTIYVAPVYDRQRQAIAASLSEPVTVVTGPPGTGKSQFILNLIVQAVMRGEKVLFASHNNKAVDVVMQRLQGDEIKFPGAIRTGKKEDRRRAVDQISARLREILQPDQNSIDINVLQEKYWDFQRQYLEKLSQVKKVRSKSSMLVSRAGELEDLRKLIPADLLLIAEKLSFSFNESEYENLQSFLSSERMVCLALKSRLESLSEDVLKRLGEKSEEFPLVGFLQDHEDQWGTIGAESLHPASINSLQDVTALLRLWSIFLSALNLQSTVSTLTASYRDLKTELDNKEKELSEEELVEARQMSQTLTQDTLSAMREKARDYLRESQRIKSQKWNLWLRLSVWMGFRNPLRNLAGQLLLLQGNFKSKVSIPANPRWQDRETLEKIALKIASIVETSYLTLQVAEMQERLDKVRHDLQVTGSHLPSGLAQNVKKLNPPAQVISTTSTGLDHLAKQVDDVVNLIENSKASLQRKLDENSDELEFLRELQSQGAEQLPGLGVTFASTDPETLARLLSNWRDTLTFWKTQDVISVLKQELLRLPTEEASALEARKAGNLLFPLGARILTEQWKKKVRSHDASTYRKAEQFVSAAQQLLEGSTKGAQFAQLKGVEEDTRSAVMELFPVWATTNLSAKSNFPLLPELFDLVIIDEASQCDLPSALPLLYRAKRVVIVGDAMQLRHIAQIIRATEEDVAQKHAISLAQYSYSHFSLFDIARRSVHTKPATIVLNEHYRSDPQIFGFSKEEFYEDEKIEIHTDMARFALPEDYIKSGTGVFWVDIPGRTQRPGEGSAYNTAEMNVISELVPRLLDHYQRQKMDHIDLGIISPYREQEKRVLSWLASFPTMDRNNLGRITAGTAHKFQGDERDVVIFSPVLSQDITEKSLEWLERTSNLLNVAISRARLTLIVVGDWRYCLALHKGSKYRALAEYVARHPNRVVDSIDALPIFKGLPVDIIGLLLDRHNRDRNRLALRKLLLACEDYVYWMDPFISNGVFDLLLDIARHPEFKLKDIRVITSREQEWAERYPINPSLARNIREELARNGVSFELGMLPKHEMAHDRYFYSKGYAINMPPFGGAYGDHPMVSEYTESKTTPEFFEKYWLKAKKY